MTKISHLYSIDFPNGKRYIGITSDISRRFREHKKLASAGSPFPVHNAIRKYGEQNATIRALCAGHREFIADLEIKMIAVLGTQDRENGYNLTHGGDISPMHTPEVAAKVNATKKRNYETDPAFRLLLTNQALALTSPEMRTKINLGIRQPSVSAAKSAKLRGFKHSDEARRNMSAAQSNPELRKHKSEVGTVAWSDPILRKQQSERFK